MFSSFPFNFASDHIFSSGRHSFDPISYSSSRTRSNSASGSIYWDEKEKDLGKVVVTTVNSPLVVRV